MGRYSWPELFSRAAEFRKVLSDKGLGYSGSFRLFSFIHGVNKEAGGERSKFQVQSPKLDWDGAYKMTTFLLAGERLVF